MEARRRRIMIAALLVLYGGVGALIASQLPLREVAAAMRETYRYADWKPPKEKLPKDADGLYALGQSTVDIPGHDRARFELAYACAQRVIALEPKRARGHVLKARVHRRAGYRDDGSYLPTAISDARRELAIAARLEPTNPDVPLGRASLAYWLDDYETARAEVATALRMRPNYPDAQIMGVYIAEAESDDRAVAGWLRQLGRPGLPDDVATEALNARRRLDERQGRFAVVDASYEREIAAKPGDPQPKLEFANVLLERRAYKAAIRWAQAGLRDEDSAEGHAAVAEGYAGLGYELQWEKKRPEAAQAFWKKSLAEDPDNAWAHFGIGDHERRLADAKHSRPLYLSAERHLARALELDPELAQAGAQAELHAVRAKLRAR